MEAGGETVTIMPLPPPAGCRPRPDKLIRACFQNAARGRPPPAAATGLEPADLEMSRQFGHCGSAAAGDWRTAMSSVKAWLALRLVFVFS